MPTTLTRLLGEDKNGANGFIEHKQIENSLFCNVRNMDYR